MNQTLQYIVNKFNLNISGPQPIQITTVGRFGLAQVFGQLGFKEGAEVGVDRGYYSEILCQENPLLHLTCIDAWNIKTYQPLSKEESDQERVEGHYKDAIKRLSAYNCDIKRQRSLEAVNGFRNNSLDFVYIDANHNFASIACDLFYWEKKVKRGGIIAGHDYQHYALSKDNHVKHVVDAYISAFEISPYFELGQDKHHSWFWVKDS